MLSDPGQLSSLVIAGAWERVVENLKPFSLGGWVEKGGEEKILSKQRSNGEEL